MSAQPTGRKIAIIGVGGSEKSVLARQLGEILGIEVIHLDAYHWRPGWEPTPRPQWIEIQRELIGRQAWIMDGNYGGTLDTRLAAADTVIFLDLPRYICLWRALKRAFLSWSFFAFLHWIWGYPTQRRPWIMERLREYSNGRRIVTLHNPAEAQHFLDRVRADRTIDTSANAPLCDTPIATGSLYNGWGGEPVGRSPGWVVRRTVPTYRDSDTHFGGWENLRRVGTQCHPKSYTSRSSTGSPR